MSSTVVLLDTEFETETETEGLCILVERNPRGIVKALQIASSLGAGFAVAEICGLLESLVDEDSCGIKESGALSEVFSVLLTTESRVVALAAAKACASILRPLPFIRKPHAEAIAVAVERWKNDADVLEGCAKIVALAVTETFSEVRDLLFQHSIPSLLVSSMSAHENNVALLAACCNALKWCAASTDKLCDETLLVAPVAALRALSGHPHSREIAVAACGTIASCTSSTADGEVQKVLSCAGVTEELLRTIARFRTDQGVILQVMSSLWGLTSSAPRAEMMHLNVHRIAIELMDSFPRNAEIQKSGCGILRNIATTTHQELPILLEIGRAGAIRAATVALIAHPNDPDVVEEGLAVYANVSVNTPENKQAILSSNGPELIATASKRFSENEGVLEAACTAVSNTSFTVAAQRSHAAAGCIGIAINALRNFPASSRIVWAASGAIWNCCFGSPRNSDLAQESGAIQTLVATLESCKRASLADVAVAPSGALWTIISSCDDSKLRAALDAGALGVVNELIRLREGQAVQKHLLACLNREEAPTMKQAKRASECILALSPRCRFTECAAYRLCYCFQCCRPGWWVRCNTCAPADDIFPLVCLCCASKHHNGHELGKPLFLPGTCACQCSKK